MAGGSLGPVVVPSRGSTTPAVVGLSGASLFFLSSGSVMSATNLVLQLDVTVFRFVDRMLFAP